MNQQITVAAIQMPSINGQTEHNLTVASALVAEAAQQGAQLILLPEFFAIGYDLSESAWSSAEPQDGKTEQWLCQMANQHQCHIGGSYLQAKGEDFFDIFALAAPSGEIIGRIPKGHPGYVEPYLFKGEQSRHIIESELGRIGVAICYDSCFRATSEALIAGDADLLLIPLSGPTPQKRWYYSDAKMAAYNNTYRNAASKYASLLGIPAVMANKCGRWHTQMPGIIPMEESWFCGQSEISDANGNSLKEMDDQAGVIVARVTLQPQNKTRAIPASSDQYGQWIGPVPSEFKILWLFEWFGKRSYNKNPRRIQAALIHSQSKESNNE